MPEGDLEIAYCHACGSPMDVSLVAPFSNVECPLCAKHTRVKREFGPYTLLRRLAVGGMSVVFIAEDNTLGREVVVKILNEEYGGDEKRIGAFEEEARITASFSHPHVVRVFTTGRAFGRFYIAMELVPGGHFEHHIRERGSIPEAEALPLAIQVAAGLKAAHTAGLIHRDVKPGNILLDASGNAKLVDFGLALVTKGGSATAEEIWATPYYVPPETIEGQAEDFRSDIYAFGATFYHALAGRPSCDEETMDTNRLREAKRKIAPLAKVAPGTSAETCAIIERAMAHDPEQRFRSYDDLIAALEGARQRVANGVPEAVPSNSSRRAGGECLADKLALAGASLAVLGALVFGAWWVMRPNEVPEAVTGGKESVAEVPSESVDSSGGRRAGAAYREAGEALRAGDYDKARTLFIRVRDEPGVMEPTGSWAACEAAICSYLEGRAGVARRDARAAREHLERSTQVDAAVKLPLLETLKVLGGFPAVRRSDAAVVPSGPQLLVALMAGLRNWEHGMLVEALPHFEAVMAVEANGPDEWIAPYQDILRGYLADHAKLAAADSVRLPDGIEACRKRAEELELLRAGLKTKGRAAFNVRSWQLAIQSKIHALEGFALSPTPPPVVAEKVDWMAQVKGHTEACRFDEAAELLRRPELIRESGKERSEALLMMIEAASAFLGELEEELAGGAADAVLELRDKTRPGPITGTRRGGLRVRDAAGESRELAWADISPDSLIDLHRMLIKDETSEIERLRRHEQAIAFDMLAGNPERAQEAAKVLAERHPAFKRRWTQLQPGID